MALAFPTTKYISRFSLGLASPDPAISDFPSGFTSVRYRVPAQWVGSITVPVMDHRTGRLLAEVESFFERMASDTASCYVPLLGTSTIGDDISSRVMAVNASDEGMVVHTSTPTGAEDGMLVDIGDRIYRVTRVLDRLRLLVSPTKPPRRGDYIRPATTMLVQPVRGVAQGIGAREALYHNVATDNPPFNTDSRTLEFKSFRGSGVMPRPRQYFFLTAGSSPTAQAESVLVPAGLEGTSEGLSALALSTGTLVPAFSAGTYRYYSGVANTVNVETATVTAAPGCEVYIHGRTEPQLRPGDDETVGATGVLEFPPVAVGTNTLRIMVRNRYDIWYEIQLGRQPATGSLSGVSALESLEVGGQSTLSLSPAFAAATTAYTLSLPSSEETYTVTATASEEQATVHVDGLRVRPGTGVAVVSVPATGTKNTSIVVTAVNGATTTYTIAASRQAAATLTSVDYRFQTAQGQYTESDTDLSEGISPLRELSTGSIDIRPRGASGTTVKITSRSKPEVTATLPVGRYTTLTGVREGVDIYSLETTRSGRSPVRYELQLVRTFNPASAAKLTGLRIENACRADWRYRGARVRRRIASNSYSGR